MWNPCSFSHSSSCVLESEKSVDFLQHPLREAFTINDTCPCSSLSPSKVALSYANMIHLTTTMFILTTTIVMHIPQPAICPSGPEVRHCFESELPCPVSWLNEALERRAISTWEKSTIDCFIFLEHAQGLSQIMWRVCSESGKRKMKMRMETITEPHRQRRWSRSLINQPVVEGTGEGFSWSSSFACMLVLN